MATAVSGPETTNMERVRSWRWSVEPEQQGSPLDLLAGPPNLVHTLQ